MAWSFPIARIAGTVVKVHGSATERVVANAIRQIAQVASQHLTERIRNAMPANEPAAISA